METNKRPLAVKLAKILGEIGKVAKSGRNEFHKYDYVTENDLVYAVRQKLAEAGVFVFSSVEAQHVEIVKESDDKSWALTTVTTRHTFIDGESGDEFSVCSQGQGADNGDKGGYKAITGAMKYFLYKCFMIPTGDDPEGDDKTDHRGAASTGTKSKAPVQTAQRDQFSMRENFTLGRWKKVKIHFGKNKGVALETLADLQLKWYCDEWQPKPYEGKLSDADLELRSALDVAREEAFVI